MIKAQVSVEYLLIMGFATLMTIPLLIIYYKYTSETTNSVVYGQSLQIARKIIDSSESVYYLGKPSQTTLKVNFPDNIYSINLSNKELVFKVKTINGLSDIVQISSVNLSGSLPTSPGVHIVTVKAEDGYVLIAST